jgi:tetratricopeptide (TPR) repeat protein
LSRLSGENSFIYSVGSDGDDTLILDTTFINRLIISAEDRSLDLKDRIQNINKASKLSEQLNYDKGLAESLLIKSQFEFNSGLHEHASDNLLKARTIFRQLNDHQNELEVLKQIGNFNIQSQNFKSALHSFIEYYEFAVEYKQLNDRINALAGIGFVYFRLNTSDSAVYYLNQSSQLAESNNIPYPYERNMVIISNSYYNQNEFEKASEYIRKVNIEESNVPTNPRGVYYYLYALIELKSGNDEKADSLYKLAGNIKYDNEDLITLDDLLFIKYKADSTFNRHLQAFITFREMIDHKQKIDENEFRTKLANFQVLSDIDQKQNEINKLEKEKYLKVVDLQQQL